MDTSKVLDAIKERRSYPVMGLQQDSETKYAERYKREQFFNE